MAAAAAVPKDRTAYEAIVRSRNPSVDYAVERQVLGKGTFGAVYRGVDRATGLTVALKYSHLHLSGTALAKAREEAEVMQRVRARPRSLAGSCPEARTTLPPGAPAGRDGAPTPNPASCV